MEKLIFIGLLIFSVKCFSMDGIPIVYNPQESKIDYEYCRLSNKRYGGFVVYIDGQRRTNCINRSPDVDKDVPFSLSTDRLAIFQNQVANAKALGKKVSVFIPDDYSKKLVYSIIDEDQTKLKKCEADLDIYKNIAQIMSTNGAGKTESTIEAVADYMSSSVPKSDAKGE